MTDNPAEIAERLRDQIATVEKMAFTLKLIFPQADISVDRDANCVCEWMRDAIRVLSTHPTAERS